MAQLRGEVIGPRIDCLPITMIALRPDAESNAQTELQPIAETWDFADIQDAGEKTFAYGRYDSAHWIQPF